jgi:hypothetical protein
MRRIILFSLLTNVFALVIVLTAYVSAQSADTLAPSLCRSVSHESSTTYENDDIDLGTCERMCRRRFGYEPSMADGNELFQNAAYWAYAQCVQDCNRTFWKEFDRKTRDRFGGD